MKNFMRKTRQVFIACLAVVFALSFISPALADVGLGVRIDPTGTQNFYYGKATVAMPSGTSFLLMEQPAGTAKFRVDGTGKVQAANGFCDFSGNCVSPSGSNYWSAGVPANSIYNTNTGNVGIGTNNPGYKLDINGDLNVPLNNALRFNGGWGVGSDATQISIGSQAVAKAVGIYPQGNNTPAFYANTSGNVGIGTTGPNAKLDVNGEAGMSSIRETLNSYNGTDLNDSITHKVFMRPTNGGYSPAHYFRLARIKLTGDWAGAAIHGFMDCGSDNGRWAYRNEISLNANCGSPCTNPASQSINFVKNGSNSGELTVYYNANGDGANHLYVDLFYTSGWYSSCAGELEITGTGGSPVTVWQTGVDTGTTAPAWNVATQNIGYNTPGGLWSGNGIDSYSNYNWSGGWNGNLRLSSPQFPAIRFFAQNSNKTSMIGNDNDGALWFGVNGTGDTAGPTAMLINASGNVSIGTNAPLTKLDVRGNVFSFDSSAKNSIDLVPAAGAAQQVYADYWNGGTEQALILGTYSNRTSQLYLATNGYVGIGNTGPNHKLQVNGSIHTNAAESGGGGNLASDSYDLAGYSAGVQTLYSYGRICAGNNSGDCSAAGGVTISSGGQVGTPSVSINNTGNSYFNAGNLGIGSTNPGNKLTVNGDIGAQNLILSSAQLATYAAGNQAPPYYLYQTTGSSDYWQIYGEGTNNNGALVFETGDDGSEPFIFRQKQSWSPYTRTRDSMIIDGNGYVGIGVSPSNAKLEVEGGAGPSNIAIYGHGSGSNGTGVYGNGNGGSYGVRGIGGPDGVEGEGTTNGVEGNGATNGIQGGGAVVGVHGYNESCLMGSCYMEGPSSIGVYGESDWGVGVKARGTTYDFYGASSNPSYFTGPVSTGGALTSGGALTAGGVLHLAQIPDSSAGTCNSANAGSMYYSTNYYTICYCRGGQWCNMVSGSCGDSTHCHS